MQPTEYPGQQREDERVYLGKAEREKLVHMSTLQLGKHPLLDVCRVNMGGAHCQPPVQKSTSRRKQSAVLKKKIQLCSSN